MTSTDAAFGAFPLSPRYALHRDGGRRARRVRLLGGTSDWRRDALERTGAAAVALLGTRRWRPTEPWRWPLLDADDLLDRLRSVVPGIVIDATAMPRQANRARLSLLCHAEPGELVVKLGRPDDGIETEAAALTLLVEDPLPGIATPSVIASGVLAVGEPVAFLITSALGLDGQRPAIDEPLRTFEADLTRRLRLLERPPATPSDWVPTHGDLAPWNLRRTPYGLALFDWEAAGWRPPGHDLAHYRRTCADLRR